MRNSYFNYNLNQKKFDKYFSYIEKYFKCTGFCGLNYFNENTQTNSKIVKYLFSDISEVPKNFGCLKKILGWFKIKLFIFGSIFLCLFLFQLFLVVLIVLNFYKKEQNQLSENSTKKKIKVNKIINSIIGVERLDVEVISKKSEENTNINNVNRENIHSETTSFNPAEPNYNENE